MAADVIVCRACGKECASAHGIAVHTARAHTKKEAAPKPVEVTTSESEVVELDQARGRECAEPGCTTRLSTYNKGDRCGVHDSLVKPPKFARASS